MREEELFREAQAGDRTSFGEWCRNQGSVIGQFGYQNGVPSDRLALYQEAAYRAFGKQLSKIDIEQAEMAIYEQAMALLNEYSEEQPAGETEKLLRFEEDLETHHAIQQLPKNRRVIFTLFYFHQKNKEELALLTGRDSEEIEDELAIAVESLTTALQLESNGQTEKRIEFVGKSYSRIQTIVEEEDLLSGEPEEKPELSKKTSVRNTAPNKKVAALLVAAGLFLTGVIGASFMLNDENPKVTASADEEGEKITRELIEDWRAKYKEVRKTAPERMGIQQKVFDQFSYVKEADAKLKRILSDKNIKKMENDPEILEKEMKKALISIETPRGMVDSLSGIALPSEESQEFLHEYALKTKEIMGVIDMALLVHQEELEEMKFDGELSPEKLMANQKKMPEELQRLLGGMHEQGLMISAHPYEAQFISRRNMETLFSNEVLNMDFYTNEYSRLLQNEPYFDEQGLLVEAEFMPYVLNTMELALIESENYSRLYLEFEYIFQHSFWLMVKGSDADPIFDSKGVVHEKYQTAWKEMMIQSGNPLIYTLLPIVEEMEASGWTKSESYDALAYTDIVQALYLEKEQKLAEKMPNGDVKVDHRMVDLANFDFSETEKRYKAFSKNHDAALLENVEPLDILFLYYYANKLEDKETMWHLTAENGLKPGKEQFLSQWRKQPDIFENVRWVETAKDGVGREGRTLFLYPSMSYGMQGMISEPTPKLIMEENHTWLVENQMIESYVLEEEPEYRARVKALYEKFAIGFDQDMLETLTAGEISGMFFYAREVEDYAAMQQLSEEDVVAMDSDYFMEQLKTRAVPKLSEISRLLFSSETLHYDLNLRPSGRIQYELKETGAEYMMGNGHALFKTDKGWRIGNMDMY